MKPTMKVWILDGGSLVIDRSQVLWHIDVGTPVRFPVYSVLIEHPDGLFMYDTGYDLDHVNRVLPFEQPQQTPDQSIPAQLKKAGFDPGQVNFVVNSHFHFDHVGGNKYLTNATTLVNTAELRHAKVPEPFEHLGYSDAETAGKAAAEIGGLVHVADVSDQAQVGALVATTADRFGTIDILVNDAAIVPFVPWEELDFAEWRRVMSVNIDGVFLTCKAVYPYMKEAGYGRIVNICSNVVTAGTPNMAHYVASKGAVFSFTRSLATEVGQYGITVNAVAPGLTASEGVLDSPHAEAFDFVVSLQSIPRRGVPSDIAPAVAFLASEEAHWITGQMLTADGGHTRH